MKSLKNTTLEYHGQIRTVYQGDEKREADEIAEYEDKRKQVIDEFGIGDLARGEGD